MKKINGIIFDYGETLISESVYDCKSGMAKLLEFAIVNPMNATPDCRFSN
ncbi:MAG: hypothetical protein ACLKAK_10770 [Alkaliphilus sp.]